MSSIFLSRNHFGGNLNANMLSQTQNVLKGWVTKGDSFRDTSEFVTFILKFWGIQCLWGVGQGHE